MKKTPAKKTVNTKSRTRVRPVATKPSVKPEKTKPCFNPWSVSIYVYWFIILFFIASTFYIFSSSYTLLYIINRFAHSVGAQRAASEKDCPFTA
ncbi:MAG: hypothetical protein IKZ00_02715 [Bacteroidaceae bacterium]|nr:hypothetical protein [Bacteroidaceae bacterium]